MLGIIQPDNVYTPVWGHLAWDFEDGCPFCGADQSDWAHFIFGVRESPAARIWMGFGSCVKMSGGGRPIPWKAEALSPLTAAVDAKAPVSEGVGDSAGGPETLETGTGPISDRNKPHPRPKGSLNSLPLSEGPSQ